MSQNCSSDFSLRVPGYRNARNPGRAATSHAKHPLAVESPSMPNVYVRLQRCLQGLGQWASPHSLPLRQNPALPLMQETQLCFPGDYNHASRLLALAPHQHAPQEMPAAVAFVPFPQLLQHSAFSASDSVHSLCSGIVRAYLYAKLTTAAGSPHQKSLAWAGALS